VTTTNGQYPPKVCKRLDALHEQRSISKVREKDLVNTRKALRGELLELGPGETDDHKRMALDMWRTVCEIEYQRDRIKVLAEKIDDTIANAHQAKLFDEDEEKLPPAKPSDKTLFETLLNKQPGDEEQPSEPKERAETPDEEDPGVAEGENQHLAASVSELNMGKDEVDQCVAAGCTTVGALKRVMDEDPTWGELAKKLGLTGQAKPLNAIGRAVKEFCKTHEKAALAKFKGEENGPRVDHRKSRGERIGKGATKTKGEKVARK